LRGKLKRSALAGGGSRGLKAPEYKLAIKMTLATRFSSILLKCGPLQTGTYLNDTAFFRSRLPPDYFGTANSSNKRGIYLSMKTKLQLSVLFLGAVLTCGPALAWSQPSSPSQDSGPKQDIKDGAKDVGHGVQKGTKKVVHGTKHVTKKVWHKTKNTTTGAVKGGKEGAKKPE
jgi:hypothetical protein